MYLRILASFCLLFSFLGVSAQHSIMASEVESWISEDMPSSDFNLNSAYVYLLNPQSLQDVFSGDDLSRKSL